MKLYHWDDIPSISESNWAWVNVIVAADSIDEAIGLYIEYLRRNNTPVENVEALREEMKFDIIHNEIDCDEDIPVIQIWDIT